MSRMRLPLIPGWTSILVPCVSSKEFKLIKRRNKMKDEKAYKVTHNFYIAGVQFHELKTIIRDLEEGDGLELVPEPSNKYDPNAVRIEHNNVMTGFVPKKFSSEVAAALEVGKDLECVLVEVNKNAKPWEQAKVEIREVLDE